MHRKVKELRDQKNGFLPTEFACFMFAHISEDIIYNV